MKKEDINQKIDYIISQIDRIKRGLLVKGLIDIEVVDEDFYNIYSKAKDLVIKKGKINIDELVQKFKISYEEATVIFDKLINDGAYDLYKFAKETVLKDGIASASFLQRKLKIGYARAARVLDQLEEEGVVGPAKGAEPRKVYK